MFIFTAGSYKVFTFFINLKLIFAMPYIPVNYTNSVEHNTGLFKTELRLYMYAACFGPFSDSHQAWLYKNVIKEDMTR
jgi:hypothetical protein